MEVKFTIPTPENEEIFTYTCDEQCVICWRDLFPKLRKALYRHNIDLYSCFNWNVYMQPITANSKPIHFKKALNESRTLQSLSLILLPKNVIHFETNAPGDFLHLFNDSETFHCLKIRPNKLPKMRIIEVRKYCIVKLNPNSHKSCPTRIFYEKMKKITVNEKNKKEFTLEFVDFVGNSKREIYRMNCKNIPIHLKEKCKQQNNLLIAGYVKRSEQQCDLNIPKAIQDTISTYSKHFVAQDLHNQKQCKDCVCKMKYIKTIRKLSPLFPDS